MSVLAAILSMSLAATPSVQPLSATAKQDLAYAVDGIIEHGYAIQNGPQRLQLVLSRTGNFALDGREGRSARLYATLFSVDQNGFQQLWQIKDLVSDCPFDLTVEFTAQPIHVADADADGQAEIWVSYLLACRSDVAPADLKLIGYEGKQKYALRGLERRNVGPEDAPVYEGGAYQADAASKAAPKILSEAARYWARLIR
jgi:hypothetical protein